MADNITPSPENVLARGDTGDETSSRYRFQWTWAAIMCCMLLDDTEDVEEVFCEHHEDILLKHRDGSFTGQQVKTRSDNQPPWKVKDKAVRTACSRFVRLESEYPESFRCFCFLTNHPLHSSKNSQSLPYVLKLIKDAGAISELPLEVVNWVRIVARDASVTETIAFTALSKTVTKSDLPKLRDVFIRLMDAITQSWTPAAECSFDAMRRAAQALIHECFQASSLNHEQLLPAYVIVSADDNADRVARINGKRMTLARVQQILERSRDSIATLACDPTLFVEPGAGSTELMHKKLDAGGFSIVTRNSAEDLRIKADYLGITWINKYGHDKGLERYNHIRSLVLSDAGRAFDVTQTDAESFGPAMREDLRRRFRQRRMDDDQLFDSTDDHLEGIAFSLTAQCEIVWSNDRPWEVH